MFLAAACLFPFSASHAAAEPGHLALTDGHRPVRRKYLLLFQAPSCCQARRREIELYFQHHFGLKNALRVRFVPRSIVLHATENDSEMETYSLFNSSANPAYLGGVWSHFSVTANGTIVQYAPLDRVSKAHFGVNDLAVGIEMVGRIGSAGSIMQRYQSGDHRQLLATLDLVKTLQRHFAIPGSRVFSHEEVAHIGTLNGSMPDFRWLRRNIRDRVYLGLVPDLDRAGRLTNKSQQLEPYERYDPGQKVMAIIRRLL